jgi:hypothetical protein
MRNLRGEGGVTPIRRTPRNLAIAGFLTLPIALPFLLLRPIFAWLADRCEWVTDELYHRSMRLFETHNDRRTRLLRGLVGTWIRHGSWVCACPATRGSGWDACPKCGTPQPPNEPEKAT